MNEPDKIIEALGGTAEVGRICGLTMSTVSAWRRNGVPRGWYMYFTLLRPELFPNEAAKN